MSPIWVFLYVLCFRNAIVGRHLSTTDRKQIWILNVRCERATRTSQIPSTLSSISIFVAKYISKKLMCKKYHFNGALDAVQTSENGCIALLMTTTWIAAQLLYLRRTYHSRIKAPLYPAWNSTLNITKQKLLSGI